MDYHPRPIDTGHIVLDDAILQLTEKLARNTHEIWAKQRVADGWRYGPKRCDEKMEHPGLVPYDQLSEKEKAYDRIVAMEALRAIVALGYRLVRT